MVDNAKSEKVHHVRSVIPIAMLNGDVDVNGSLDASKGNIC